MELNPDAYSDINIRLKYEPLPIHILKALSDYFNGNVNAFDNIPYALNDILQQASLQTKMELMLKSENYKNRNQLCNYGNGDNLDSDFYRKASMIIRRERLQDFKEIVKSICNCGLIDIKFKFERDATKAHNRLLYGIGAILYRNQYFKTHDENNQILNENQTVKRFFHLFEAHLSIKEYSRAKKKEKNILLVDKKFPIIGLIELKRQQNNYNPN